jgi:hypothetical protein
MSDQPNQYLHLYQWKRTLSSMIASVLSTTSCENDSGPDDDHEGLS